MQETKYPTMLKNHGNSLRAFKTVKDLQIFSSPLEWLDQTTVGRQRSDHLPDRRNLLQFHTLVHGAGKITMETMSSLLQQ